MKTCFWILLALALGAAQQAFPLDSVQVDAPTPSVGKPVSISSKELIPDGRRYQLPDAPSQNFDGTSLGLGIDVDLPPMGPAKASLNDPSALAQIPTFNKSDAPSGKYSWHQFKDSNYCHVKKDGRDWYGWGEGGKFHWALWWEGRFWWRDDYAERWLYLDQGNWWWQSSKKKNHFQVFLQDGHYHVCDLNGALVDDLMRAGTEEEVTQPVVKDTDGNRNWDQGNPTGAGGAMGGGMGAH